MGRFQRMYVVVIDNNPEAYLERLDVLGSRIVFSFSLV